MANGIEALFFDFGGVLTHSPFKAIAQYADKLKVDPMVLGKLIFGEYGNDTQHSWHKLERGEIDFQQAADDINMEAKKQGIKVDLMEAFSGLGNEAKDVVRHEMVDHVRMLKKENKYKLALITNNIAEYRDGWRSLFDVDNLFPHIIDSSVEGIRKPNHKIYHLAMERVGVRPENSVFLDDFEANVEAARAVGMHGILVTEDMQSNLQKLNGILTKEVC